MSDPLHPAAPVVPSAPAEPVAPAQALSDPYGGPYLIDCSRVPLTEVDRAALNELGSWPILRSAPAAWPFPVELAEPDPIPAGDPFPFHLLDAELQAPLPPVLREDAPPPVLLNCSDGLGWTPFTQSRFNAWLTSPIKPRRPGFLRRLWDEHHEWIAVGAILVLARMAAAEAKRERRRERNRRIAAMGGIGVV